MPTLDEWEARFERFLHQTMLPTADAAHDLAHVQRVVRQARRLALAEGAELAVVLPAAWLHDCVIVDKGSPQRREASRLAAEAATAFLRAEGYPAEHLEAIAHAIHAHSFSAAVAPQTLEARVVQDADRLDALGAIGIARTMAVGGALGRAIYEPAEPIPQSRPANDQCSSLDHFYTKLFTLAATMQSAAGRAEAERRTETMRAWVAELMREIEG